MTQIIIKIKDFEKETQRIKYYYSNHTFLYFTLKINTRKTKKEISIMLAKEKKIIYKNVLEVAKKNHW